jgi:SH3 domain-containing YSC84-like protein 1
MRNRSLSSAQLYGNRPHAGRISLKSCAAPPITHMMEVQPQEEARIMKKTLFLLLTFALVGLPAFFVPAPVRADNQEKDEDRLQNAGQVIKEILNIPDDIPQSLLDKADCVVVIPTVLKAAFIVGASYGRGAMTCRSGDDFQGPWGAPTMMALEGGSFGLQIGGQATDFVLLVMNRDGAGSILSSKVKLGGDAEADTDVALRAEVLTYSRARGLFAGISLEGSTLRPDDDANERIYGKRLPSKDIALHGAVPIPHAARALTATLNQHSPKNLSK